jgi:glutaredoxin
MFCQRTKEYLSQKQIPFQERDVTTDAEAIAELQRLGYMTTPVTVVNGTVIVGFDAAKIEAALGS